ncbi:hypothetical protein BV352_05364 [Pseudomonas syringae pv. actinidiae]|nr:hypothetical protein BV352_05364 [Pseudomonas syringae pv. actinidiae]
MFQPVIDGIQYPQHKFNTCEDLESGFSFFVVRDGKGQPLRLVV